MPTTKTDRRARQLVSAASRAQSLYLDGPTEKRLDGAIDATESLFADPAFATFDSALRSQFLAAAAQFYQWVSDQIGDLALALRAADLYQLAMDDVKPGSEPFAHYDSLLQQALDAAFSFAQLAMEEADGSTRVDDIDRVIEILAAILERVPERLAEPRSGIQGELGTMWSRRFELSHDSSDLDQALSLSQQSLDLLPADSPERVPALNNLADDLAKRYWLSQDRADLDRQIELYEAAVLLGRDLLVPNRTSAHNLGAALLERYEASGEVADLDRSIVLLEAVVKNTAAGERERAMHVTSLGNALSNRFRLTSTRADIERAVSLYGEALDLTPEGSPSHRRYESHVGNALRSRFRVSAEPKDLDRAVELHSSAVTAATGDLAEQSALLHNFAATLRAVFDQTGRDADLDRLVEVATESVARTPTGDLNLPGRLSLLAAALGTRYERHRREADATAASDTFRSATTAAMEGRAEWALQIASEWGQWATFAGSPAEAAEAYGQALEVSAQLFRIQLDRMGKELWLRQSQGLAVRTALARTAVGDLAGAVAAIEGGLAFMLSEALGRDRSDLARLDRAKRGALRERFVSAARRADALAGASGIEGRPSEPAGSRIAPGQPRVATDLRATLAELDAVVAEIRIVPGFERFLLVPTWEEIAKDLGASPLLYLGAGDTTGLCLRVDPAGFVVAELLPDLTLQGLQEQVLTYRRVYEAYATSTRRREDRGPWEAALDALLRWTWDHVMARVIESAGTAERATLVPAGILGALPLHSAWTVDEARPTRRRYALDGPVLTYAPNARALAAARARWAAVAGNHLLVVNEPDLGKADLRLQLPYSAAEAAVAVAAFPDHEVLGGAAATKPEVLAALSRSQVVHLSCHGRVDPARPLESALAMAAAEPLTLRDILAGQLDARLAVLSACETAITGEDLPDEVVGFTSGLLQAGAGAAIASLWAVPGVATALLMARFYAGWRPGETEPADALRDAQQWVRDTSHGDKLVYVESLLAGAGRQIEAAPMADLYRALALDPTPDAGLDHASPYHWAAFCYVGA